MRYLFIVCLLASIQSSYGCTMEGVAVWQLPLTVRIEDYHEGIIFQRAISDIGGFTLTSYNDLNGGPYVDAAIENSAFVLRANEAYREYEENETSDLISLTFSFSCTNGATLPSPLTIRIEINDNNNNPPLFKTPDTAASAATTYEFTIAPPVPPGFLITNCVSDIIVRDIDLTTYRIDFEIEDNPYVEIAYDEAASTDPKEFKAVLRTTTFIRSIPEPIILTISATDVDETGDPPITTSTTVTIHGSAEFELPVEPVFSQAFYLASYTENHQVTQEQSITLQQGYDELVDFSLEGDYAADHFAITVNGNQVILSVTNPLPAEALQEAQIYLVVNATREYTSGASATIVVQLPEAVGLEFERPHYEGEIVDNTLQLTQLILSQGYQGSDVTVTVEDYTLFFTTSISENIITLSMTPLDDNIIQENNFINLRVTASTGSSAATAIVTLEIVKDDVTTPAFDRPLYTGTYDSTTGLTVDTISLVQGYDETVTVSLSGEYESYFELDRDGPSSTLRVAGTELPSHILTGTHLLLTVHATKPRTVGASAVVSVTLPGARELQFEASSYKGSLQDNILTVETIILSVGYGDDVTFTLSGDYSTSFAVSNVQNQVSITIPAALPQEVISENNFLILTLNANGLNALPTTTAVLVEIIKDDATTPVFSQPIYYGTYIGSSSIGVDIIDNINLIQGYDDSVTFRIQGENSEYFTMIQNGNMLSLTVQSSIPEELVFQEKAFVFNILADKPLTVGANTAIVIKFNEELTGPSVMQFAQNTYIGSLENNVLTLESIVLETGFAVGTQFELVGDYAASFTHTVTDNIINLSITSALPDEVLENNKFIVLELEARRDRAVSVVAGIVIDLVKEEIVIPVFSQAFYTGIYTEENALQFQETVTLTQGFDETVTFGLEGESAAWFSVVQNGNSATVVSTTDVPQDVLDSHHQLLFTVVAHKPNSINGYAAISIELPKDVLEQEVLRFTQSSYEGLLDGTELQVPTITLSNDVTDNILVSLSGAYAAYFTATRDSNIIHIELMNDLPSEVISDNEFIVLDIIASKPDAVNGYTALVLSIVKEPTIVTPVFEQPYYTGEISEQGELLFEHTMRLIQGFDESVSFTLNGDGSERFILIQSGQNSLTLAVAEGGLGEIENINNFVFSIVANKAGSISGQAAIVIHNTDSSTPRTISFSQNYYKGSLEDNLLTMETLSIVEGYTSDVLLSLTGDYVEYFQLVGQDGTYTLQLLSNIPNEIIEANNVLVYSLEAYTNDARTHATVIVELIKDNLDETALTFDEAYYIGSYSATSGVMEDIRLRIATGYDSDIVFTVEEAIGALFNIQHVESIVTVSLVAPLPVEIFINNRPVIFAVTAINSAGKTTTATIIVALEGELTGITVLGFERNNYLGAIESGTSTLEPIILTQGYSSEVHFTLQGDLSNYFTINQQESILNLQLQSAIPEQAIPTNRIIVLEIQATATEAISATTTIVFEVVAAEELAFSAAYYIGQYSETEGLVFDTTISLGIGYDETVQFALEGDHAQWFSLQVQGNTATLTIISTIPPAILVNNQQLVFEVTAHKTNSNIATAIIVISLVDDYIDATLLGFERASYLGVIENDVLSIEPIVLNEGYTDAVTFTLHGDLASYFSLQQQGSTVNIVLQSAIPEQAIPANRIVIHELRASAPQAIAAMTAVVLEARQTVAAEELTFSAAYYIGQYSETDGLVFDATISLGIGYDETVQFALVGEHAQWFSLQVQGNTATLAITSAIPPAILVNNHQLVFEVTAQKPNSNIATATIVISLVDDYIDATLLGFERASYLGVIENDVLSIEPVVLNEGYTDAVTFTLHGDLASYFSLQQQGSTVNIVLQSAIPEQAIPANGIVIHELRASAPQAIAAMTAVVLEVRQTVAAEELTFSAAYYIGQYSETEGLVFDATISLGIGYDETVQFALEGDHAQWFSLQVQGNTATLTMTGAIPPAILVNNHQLVFEVTALKPNSNIATAIIVISLVDDYIDATLLGFERASYLGVIENDVLSIEPIVLNEGYTDAVTFTLHGDLASFFSLQQQGSTVNIVLQSAIPEQAIPANGIVIHELRASAPQAIAAMTAVVLEVRQTVAAEELAFSAAYYIGQYSETEGLVFDTTISLGIGYDETVQFALEGEHAQWFSLQVQGNTATLTMTGAIPPAILVNNHQLVFEVTALKPNSNIATAIIVISLVDDYIDATLLGFERASYLGVIENDVLSIEPIVLNEGYTGAVTFTLHGDLASYFSLQQQGSTVNIVLQSAIPEQAIPANGIVIHELRASAPQAIAAMTAVVLEVRQTVAAEELAFSAAYYIGQYSETEGLVFDATISLEIGYDETVQFALEGEHAQWFILQVQGNTATLTMTGAIPPAILVNNHQLVFEVTAQKPNSNVATATIVISLVDDYIDATLLGFERASYLGVIENDVLSIEPIVLNEGYTDAVTFTLHGDLASYFSLQQQGSTVNIVLQSAIPEQAIPANGIVIHELRVSAPQAIAAMTAVVLEVRQTVAAEELAFSAAYYIGQYSETEGLVFDATISLEIGYDETVQFALEGEHAQWFILQVQGNTATLTMTGAIPPAILVNNHQLVFEVTAQKPNSNVATATIVISLVDDYIDATLLGFERASYLGVIENDVLSIEPIVLNEGYTDAVTFTLHGDLASYFSLQQQGSTVNIVLQGAIPEQAIPANGIVIHELRASAPQAIAAMTAVVLEVRQTVAAEELAFSAAYYIGQYSETEGLVFDTTISLEIGYDETVQFALEGDHAQWFSLQVQGNTATLTMTGAITPAILVNNHQLVFEVTALKPNSNIATAIIVISLVDDYIDATLLGFERASYLGVIENDVLSIEPIVLNEGYTDAVTFTLHGDLASYFSLQQQGSTVNIVLQSAISEQAIPANGIVIHELRASAPQAIAAMTAVVLEVRQTVAAEELAFSAAYYIGQYSETEGLVFDATISLEIGYDETVQFALEGDHAQWFSLQVQGNTATLTMTGAIPPAILVNNHQLVFEVTALKPNSNIATAIIVISLVDDYTDATLLGFERASYLGVIENDVLSIEPIVLNEGYTDAVTFTLHGDLASYFSLQQQGSTVNIVLQSAIPEQAIPANGIVIHELRASAPQAIAAMTAVVLEVRQTVAAEELAFSAAYYIGQYSEIEGLALDTIISLDMGYDQDVEFTLEGDFAEWFVLSTDGNSISLYVVEPIPSTVLVDVRKIIMIMRAFKPGHTASAVIVISVIDDSGAGTNEVFDKVLYEGTISLNVVQHETITITEYSGGEIEIFGVYRDLFSATVSGDTVVVGASGTLALPESVSHVALELRTSGASAVLIFDVIQSETPELPTVVFGSPSYVLQAHMAQTGLVGQLSASSSNGESVAYSLSISDAHLQERISINSEGEIHLSAPTNTGLYNFEAIATSTITQVQASASVQLTVEVTATCGDEHALPPLIILDRDEEEPHENLVVLDSVAQAGCQFRLTNRWPLDQEWLYVDETGLHARTIDREDPRIAFMALSQVQVELVLECDSDTQNRAKRSTRNPRLDWLGPYEYGSNRWILTDTILYNSRRSFVNLIVNDINDNYPIFVANENEPIICGYPIPELEDIVLPRALAELKATDADVGENAALSFWSSSEVLAVSPTTGSVHVRDGAALSHDQILSVSVTDLNGREDGLTSSIQLMVKLIDTSHIAVVTVRNAFLDQEETILSNLSSAVGYEVKVLSAAVISDDPADSANARHKRDVTTEGASLQLYVYGVIDREPVAVAQLKNDITENILAGVDVTSTISLEDYLEGREIGGVGRDTGLLVATIVLSVLLFILILAIALWFFLRWRKARNYEQFSDAISVASRNEPLDTPPKLDSPKKPRLNIDELKRSERRLQEMLDAPIEGVAPKAQTSQVNPEEAFDTIINIAPTDTTLPIIIQSIDKLKDDANSADEDEYGERTNKSRRKSVVTFNENVEKIIHVEDMPDDNSSDVEVFRF